MSIIDPQTELVAADEQRAAGLEAGAPIAQTSLWRDALHRYMNNKAALIATFAFIAMLAYVTIVPFVSRYDPNAVDFSQAYESPSLHHLFGTDQFGRDLFVRAALGGRISIGIGFAGTLVLLIVGILYGAISGFVGGWLDGAMMRFLDLLYGLPYLPFAIIMIAIFGEANIWTMIGRAHDRQLVHDRPGDARPDDQPEGERLRARRAGRGCALVPRPVPPPPAEHARRDRRLRLPRPARDRARRGVPLLPRPRHQPADGVVGLARAGRLQRLPARALDHHRPERLRSPG